MYVPVVLGVLMGGVSVLMLGAGLTLVFAGGPWRGMGAAVMTFALGFGVFALAVADGFQSPAVAIVGLVVAAFGAVALLVAAVLRIAAVLAAVGR